MMFWNLEEQVQVYASVCHMLTLKPALHMYERLSPQQGPGIHDTLLSSSRL